MCGVQREFARMVPRTGRPAAPISQKEAMPTVGRPFVQCSGRLVVVGDWSGVRGSEVAARFARTMGSLGESCHAGRLREFAKHGVAGAESHHARAGDAAGAITARVCARSSPVRIHGPAFAGGRSAAGNHRGGYAPGSAQSPAGASKISKRTGLSRRSR